MSATATTAPSGLPPFYRRRGFWRNAVLAIAALAAFLVGAGLFTSLHGSSQTKGIHLSKDPPTPKTVKLTPKAAKDIHGLVRQFVHTAVARKNLAESYRLIGPSLRQGISLKQWVSGQVTVVPYPVDAKTTILFEKPEWTRAKSVRLQVHVITPDKPNQTKLTPTDTFWVDLIKHGDGWLVDSWVPRWTTHLPTA